MKPTPSATSSATTTVDQAAIAKLNAQPPAAPQKITAPVNTTKPAETAKPVLPTTSAATSTTPAAKASPDAPAIAKPSVTATTGTPTTATPTAVAPAQNAPDAKKPISQPATTLGPVFPSMQTPLMQPTPKVAEKPSVAEPATPAKKEEPTAIESKTSEPKATEPKQADSDQAVSQTPVKEQPAGAGPALGPMSGPAQLAEVDNQGANQPEDPNRPTARFRRAPLSSNKIKGTLVAEFPQRLVIKYEDLGNRDPFATLIDETRTNDHPNEQRIPNIEGLKLVGIIVSPGGDNRALFSDKAGYSYMMQSGDKVQRGYVLRVENDKVYFQIFEYGWSRTVALTIENAE